MLLISYLMYKLLVNVHRSFCTGLGSTLSFKKLFFVCKEKAHISLLLNSNPSFLGKISV